MNTVYVCVIVCLLAVTCGHTLFGRDGRIKRAVTDTRKEILIEKEENITAEKVFLGKN